VEHGHVGKTEIFCKFDPQNPAAQAGVDEWYNSQSERAYKERYFALLAPGQPEEIGQSLSNYHLWWRAIQKELDPNRVSPEGGALV
jgi:hypothetical protein